MTRSVLKSNRTFDWMSSVEGDQAVLAVLNARMAEYYSQAESRNGYQAMLDTVDEGTPAAGAVADALLQLVASERPHSILEVGCGNGRVYRQLVKSGFAGDYHGIELAPHIIEQNESRHPGARWSCDGAYAIPAEENSIDLCFSFYVLEHLVWPVRALSEMLRVVRPGGHVVLAFPDFVEVGRFASQQTGLRPGSAYEKLRQGRLLDAIVTLLDSRVRLPRALRAASREIGPFPVNLRPLCLSHPDLMWPDVDGVYLASKCEIAAWAEGKGYSVTFPVGTRAPFDLHAFVRIMKPSSSTLPGGVVA